MKFRVLIDGQELMQVRFITDAWLFIADRRSCGRQVEIIHEPSGRVFRTETADQIVTALNDQQGTEEKRNP